MVDASGLKGWTAEGEKDVYYLAPAVGAAGTPAGMSVSPIAISNPPPAARVPPTVTVRIVGRVLTVIGTPDRDVIVFRRGRKKGQVEVVVNGVVVGSFKASRITSLILISGISGT